VLLGHVWYGNPATGRVPQRVPDRSFATGKAPAGTHNPSQGCCEIIAHRASEEVTGTNEAHTVPGMGEPGSHGVLVDVVFCCENTRSDPNAIVQEEGTLPVVAERLYPQAIVV